MSFKVGDRVLSDELGWTDGLTGTVVLADDGDFLVEFEDYTGTQGHDGEMAGFDDGVTNRWWFVDGRFLELVEPERKVLSTTYAISDGEIVKIEKVRDVREERTFVAEVLDLLAAEQLVAVLNATA